MRWGERQVSLAQSSSGHPVSHILRPKSSVIHTFFLHGRSNPSARTTSSCLDPEFLHIPLSTPPTMIPAQHNIWISLQQLPPRAPLGGACLSSTSGLSLSRQRTPVNTQVRSHPSSAQNLHGPHLPLSKSPSPPQNPQDPASCSRPFPALTSSHSALAHSATGTLASLLFLKHTRHSPASGPLHVLFLLLRTFFPEF